MRSEHQTTTDEFDAFTGWRKLLRFRPGQRKKIKLMSHRRDRRVARRTVWKEADDELG